MDSIIEFLKTKQIGFVKFGEPDFTQLTGLAILFVAIALISVYTVKEAQDQRKSDAADAIVEPETSNVAASASVTTTKVETPQVLSPQSIKKVSRARTPSRGRTPKKEAAPAEEEEEDRARTPGKKRAASNRRGRQSEATEVIASPEVTKTRGRAKTPKKA
mmetsp:Transcript_7392/g.5653  ORF Transcript_7392/g.5653 Transcript_7392/m.5653 type:complete len:161 (-) Transcript_7392:87-569(-)